MPTLRDVIAGPWRAVLVLGVPHQILAWGALIYPPVLTVPLFCRSRLVQDVCDGGLVARFAHGRTGVSSRWSSHRPSRMSRRAGRLAARSARPGRSGSCWCPPRIWRSGCFWASPSPRRLPTPSPLWGASLEPAPRPVWYRARRRCFDGELAGFTHLPARTGAVSAYLVFAGLLAPVAAPLHAFALHAKPRRDPTVGPTVGLACRLVLQPKGWAFALVAAAFAAYAFVPSALSRICSLIFARRAGSTPPPWLRSAPCSDPRR